MLRIHALQDNTVLQVQAQLRLALQEKSAIQRLKIVNCSVLQAPTAQLVQDHQLPSLQQMQTTLMCRERQLTPKINVAVVTSVLVAQQAPMTLPAQQTLCHCSEKLHAKNAHLESGVQQDQALNLTAPLASIVTDLTLTPQSVLREHMEQLKISKVPHFALNVHLAKLVLKMV